MSLAITDSLHIFNLRTDTEMMNNIKNEIVKNSLEKREKKFFYEVDYYIETEDKNYLGINKFNEIQEGGRKSLFSNLQDQIGRNRDGLSQNVNNKVEGEDLEKIDNLNKEIKQQENKVVSNFISKMKVEFADQKKDEVEEEEDED